MEQYTFISHVLVFGFVFVFIDIAAMVDVISMNNLFKHINYKKNKHILIWTSPNTTPIKSLGVGQNIFLQKNCAQKNCYVTSNRTFFQDVSHFDVLIFHGPEIVRYNPELPMVRSAEQLYVFASKESPAYYPSCNQNLNNYFNWTWTYRLKSEQLLGYLIIKDKTGNVVGPKEDIKWIRVEHMEPIDEELKYKLDGKHKAAAWFVSNCRARNNRRQIAMEIKNELENHGLTLDVYGKCGWMSCKWDSAENCSKLIEKHYYFYLSFENSFSEDYVTEKLLRALNHYAVPVVYGGANYTRFMPDGIYLNVRNLGVKNVVKQMVYLINNKDQYYNYFRWHNHYSYHLPSEFAETDPFCNFCATINNQDTLNQVTDYEYFDVWWNELYTCTSETSN